MSTVTLGGNPVNVAGNFLKPGDNAPEFSLTGKDLKRSSSPRSRTSRITTLRSRR